MLEHIKYILNFEWLTNVAITPARGLFLGLFIVIGILVLLIPNDYIYEGVEERKWWHNLKLWAWLDLAFIFTVYYIF